MRSEAGVEVSRAVEVGRAALLAGGVFLAATPALAAYRVAGAAVMVAAAAAVSFLASGVAVRLLRVGPLGSYGISVAGLFVLLLCGDGPHLAAIARDAADGPNRILSETLPLSGSRASMSALVVLVWVCGAATAEIGLRRQGVGTAWGSFALAVPVVLYVACFAVASSAPAGSGAFGVNRWAGPALLLALAGAAVCSHVLAGVPGEKAGRDDGPGVSPGGDHGQVLGVPLLGAALAAALAAVLVLIAPSVSGLSARPVALHRRPPTEAGVITDPLASMAQLRDGDASSPPVPLLALTVSVPWSGYLPVGYLDSYDGGEWRFSAGFQPTGGRIPAASDGVSPLSGMHVHQSIRVRGSLPVPLLPAIDRPSEVTGLAVVADPSTGMVLPQRLRPDVAYSVDSTGPDKTVLGISPVGALGSSPDPADIAIPPGTSPYLATTVRFVSSLAAIHPAADLPFLRDALLALRTSERRVDPTLAPPPGEGSAPGATTVAAPGGTSLSGVINAVTVVRAATPEQFATFYAMVARYLGIPARVVTGFRVTSDDGSASLPAGAYTVTNRQAWAWVEIPVQGYGWVICDPTPTATTAAGVAPPESVSAPTTTVAPLRADAVPRLQESGGHALAPPARARSNEDASIAGWAAALLCVAAALLAVAAAGPGQAAVRRWIRRRRRRSTDPAGLAVGAWLELLDALERAGMRPPGGATSQEVTEEVGHHFGADLVPVAAELATLADRAVFSTKSPVTAAAAERAWTSSRQLGRQVLGHLDTRQRIRSSCAVGSAPSRPHQAGRE